MRRWQLALGILVSAVFLYFALKGLDLPAVWATIRGARYAWIVPGVAVYFGAVWARTWRWHYLLRPIKYISTKAMFPVVAIGYMGNNIYPVRAGELLRAYVLRRRENVAISASLATIIVERALDGVVMLSFVFINLPELATLTSDSGFAGSIQALAIIGAVVFFSAVLVFMLMAVFPKRAMQVIEWLTMRLLPERFRTRVIDLSERFLEGFAALRSPLDVLMVLVTSIVIWLLETGKYWFVMHGFDFGVPFYVLMLMNGVVNLATTIPSSPGYVGTFDAPGIAILAAYGVNREVATAYTLVLHAALWFPITALGAYYMWRESVSWAEFGVAAEAKAGG